MRGLQWMFGSLSDCSSNEMAYLGVPPEYSKIGGRIKAARCRNCVETVGGGEDLGVPREQACTGGNVIFAR